jgi:hypothetical protein
MARKVKRITDLGSIFQAIFADLAGIMKTSDGGLDWVIKGSATTAVRVGENATVMLYNSTGGTLFVAFGAQAMAAPTAATDGLPVLAGETRVYNSGSNPWVRASAAGVFAYVGDSE